MNTITNKRLVTGWLGASLLALMLSACEFEVSTSSIGNITASKEKNGGPQSTTFDVMDKIYVTAVTKNVSKGTQIKWRTYTMKVDGQTENSPITNFDNTTALPGSGTADYNLTPTANGWPSGTYKIEATMLLEGGKQQDQKSIEITVKAS